MQKLVNNSSSEAGAEKRSGSVSLGIRARELTSDSGNKGESGNENNMLQKLSTHSHNFIFRFKKRVLENSHLYF